MSARGFREIGLRGPKTRKNETKNAYVKGSYGATPKSASPIALDGGLIRPKPHSGTIQKAGVRRLVFVLMGIDCRLRRRGCNDESDLDRSR